MKKLICIITVFALGIAPCSAISAESYGLYDVLKGQFVASKNMDSHMLFASTTKIMTALVALSIYDPDDIVEIKREWTGIEGSSMYLKPGEKISVLSLLYGLLLESGNDAAVALASLYTGRQEDFVTLMNAKAIEIGADSTFFENPSGLDGKNHKTTAHDLALITAEAMKNELFCQIVSTTGIELSGRYFVNHNKLLKMDDSIVGVKTGYTKKAGRCLVSCMDKGGRRYIAVTLNDPDDWDDHLRLYGEYCKETKPVSVSDSLVGLSVPVIGDKSVKANIEPDRELTLPLLEGEKLVVKIEGPRFVYGKTEKGGRYGVARVYVDGVHIDDIELIYAQSVQNESQKRSFFTIWNMLSFKK